MLKCMKGSVWLCEGCEETFSDMQSRLDSLSNENVVLSTKLKELEGLPLVVRTLQSQIAFISNDLNFILNGNESESSKVDRNKAAPPPPPINISNRFSSLSRDCKETGPIVTDHARPVPLQYIAPAGSPLPDTPSATSLHATIGKSPSSPSKEGHPTKKSSNAHPTPDRMRHSSPNLPKHGRFYLRGVLKSTPTENVKAKLASFGLTAEQLNSLYQPASAFPVAARKFLVVSLDTATANKIDRALKANNSLGWFLSVSPPRGPKMPRVSHEMPDNLPSPNGNRSNASQPTTYAQAVSNNRQHTSRCHMTNPHPGNFRLRPIPPLMSLKLGHGMSGGGP